MLQSIEISHRPVTETVLDRKINGSALFFLVERINRKSSISNLKSRIYEPEQNYIWSYIFQFDIIHFELYNTIYMFVCY